MVIAIAIAMASHKKSRVYLSLEKKVEIIKHTQSNPGLSLRSLEILFGCGKTQIGKILKNKESILASYQSNASGSRVHTISKARNSEYSEINDALYKWFVLARSKNIPVGGPQLIEKAKMIAATLGKPEFKGSQGWLEKWKKRFAIKQLKICGESGEVQGETVDSWKERLGGGSRIFEGGLSLRVLVPRSKPSGNETEHSTLEKPGTTMESSRLTV